MTILLPLVTAFELHTGLQGDWVIFFKYLFDFCSFQGHRPAVCTDNVTGIPDKDPHSGEANYVETFICQSTIIPSDGRGFSTAVASQSIILADTFLGRLVITFSRWKT